MQKSTLFLFSRGIKRLFAHAVCFSASAIFLTSTASVAAAQTVDELKAQKEIFVAKNELLKTKVSALGLQENSGATTLKDGFGEIEGWMLTSQAMALAGARIAEQVAPSSVSEDDTAAASSGNNSKKKILILSGSEKLSVGSVVSIAAEISVVSSKLTAAKERYCPGVNLSASTNEMPEFFPAIGLAMSLLKSETTIDGYTIGDAENAVISMVASSKNADWIVPKEIAATGEDSQILEAFNKLRSERVELASCLRRKAVPADTDEKKAIASAIEAELTVADALGLRLTKPRDTGDTELDAAIIAEKMSGLIEDSDVLRITVEKAGGSILNRKNVFTSLGASAVGVTGGLVVSWRLVNPKTGSVLGSGVETCRTSLASLRAVQKGKTKTPSCQWE